MTDEQKYAELLKEIGQNIREKNDQICVLQIRLSNLERELKTANETIIELRKGKTDGE